MNKTINMNKTSRGGSKIFSTGGGGGLIFSMGSRFAIKTPMLPIICAARKLKKKQAKKTRFRLFWENFYQKIEFFRRALPFKVSIYWRFYKKFCQTKLDVLTKYQMGDSLGSSGLNP